MAGHAKYRASVAAQAKYTFTTSQTKKSSQAGHTSTEFSLTGHMKKRAWYIYWLET